jgi:hypothetical protein
LAIESSYSIRFVVVSSTSFKRKVTTATETVGGPIDVVVISKEDGFIWVKRKHYFKAEPNPQFFCNDYRRSKWQEVKRRRKLESKYISR